MMQISGWKETFITAGKVLSDGQSLLDYTDNSGQAQARAGRGENQRFCFKSSEVIPKSETVIKAPSGYSEAGGVEHTLKDST